MSATPKNTVVVFPVRPGTRDVEASFQEEWDAARLAGFETGLIDDETGRLLSMPPDSGFAMYRGWIVRSSAYQRLADELARRGRKLVTSPDDYLRTYHFPEWYTGICDTDLTPRSIWFPGTQFDLDAAAKQVQAAFGHSAVVLKDYVKSRKHEWFEACFIPDAADTEAVQRVISRFLELQDEFLVGGLVFREYWPTKRIGLHPKSGAPLANEHRLFALHGRIFYSAPYWSVVEYEGSCPDTGFTAPIFSRTPSPFFAVDIAEREDGGWFVVELNDGGTAGLPQPALANAFYRSLARALDE